MVNRRASSHCTRLQTLSFEAAAWPRAVLGMPRLWRKTTPCAGTELEEASGSFVFCILHQVLGILGGTRRPCEHCFCTLVTVVTQNPRDDATSATNCDYPSGIPCWILPCGDIAPRCLRRGNHWCTGSTPLTTATQQRPKRKQSRGDARSSREGWRVKV